MRALRPALFWLLALVVCEPALAHSPIEGIGDFYNGLFHPALVPAHLLLLIALGFLIAQKGIYKNRIAFPIFLAASVTGLIIAWFHPVGDTQIVLLSVAAIVGLAVAADLPVGHYLSATAAALAGLLVGIDSAQETLAGREKLVTFLGTGLGMNLLFVYSIGIVDYFNSKPWQKIGVRIIGSWVAASSLLVLALSLSSGMK
jgi:urease accessory protein